MRLLLIFILAMSAIGVGRVEAATVGVRSGNIVCRVAGHTRQITSDGKDRQPALSPDGRTVAFIHIVRATAHPEFPDDEITALWLGDCRTGKSRLLAAASRDKDEFNSVARPVFSVDGRLIYVSLAYGGDSLVIHQVNVMTGAQKLVVYANLYSVIRSGPYRGDLLAAQHTSLGPPGHEYGGYPLYIFTPEGKAVYRIAGSENWDDKALSKWLKRKGWKAW